MRRALYVSFIVCSAPWTVPRKTQQQAFYRSTESGYTRLVKTMLFLPKVDPSVDSNRALFLACIHGHSDIVQTLLDDNRVSFYRKWLWPGEPVSYADAMTPYLLRLGHEDVVRVLQTHQKSNTL